MNAEEYQHWLSVARRFSRRPEETDDLLHDALLIAAERDRLNFDEESNRQWFTGVLRNLGAMTARSELRRRKRESQVPVETTNVSEDLDSVPATFLRDLPPSARILATLILHGLSRDEIHFVLRLSPTAYRQRLATVRRALRADMPAFRVDELALAYYGRHSDATSLERGLIRRALLERVRSGSTVGTHDPDGHLILIAPKSEASQR